MTVLDSSTIIDMLAGEEAVVSYVEDCDGPYLTSTICVYEVLEGKLGSGTTDVDAARADFGGVHSIELTEELARAAARLQDELLSAGTRMAPRDVLIAASAQSRGDELVVTDADFQTNVLEGYLPVSNPRR